VIRNHAVLTRLKLCQVFYIESAGCALEYCHGFGTQCWVATPAEKLKLTQLDFPTVVHREQTTDFRLSCLRRDSHGDKKVAGEKIGE
jgi:hypothetical protein